MDFPAGQVEITPVILQSLLDFLQFKKSTEKAYWSSSKLGPMHTFLPCIYFLHNRK